MLHREDLIRIRHMHDAGRQALDFACGKSRADLETDVMLVFAITRAIEIVGEAASKVTPEGRLQLPLIPWPQIVNMRNRLIHAYFDVDLDRVWDTIEMDLPALAHMLEPIVGGLSENMD